MNVQAARRGSARFAYLLWSKDVQAASFLTTAAALAADKPQPPARLPSRRPTPPRSSSGPPAVARQQQWVEVVDKASGQIYYWNETTGVWLIALRHCSSLTSAPVSLAAWPAQRCTPPRSRHLILPVDETTALGEPRPGPEGRRVQPAFGAGAQTSWTGLVAMGAGVGLVFAVLGRVF